MVLLLLLPGRRWRFASCTKGLCTVCLSNEPPPPIQMLGQHSNALVSVHHCSCCPNGLRFAAASGGLAVISPDTSAPLPAPGQ